MFGEQKACDVRISMGFQVQPKYIKVACFMNLNGAKLVSDKKCHNIFFIP